VADRLNRLRIFSGRRDLVLLAGSAAAWSGDAPEALFVMISPRLGGIRVIAELHELFIESCELPAFRNSLIK